MATTLPDVYYKLKNRPERILLEESQNLPDIDKLRLSAESIEEPNERQAEDSDVEPYWRGEFEMVMVALSVVVGIGNICRFPANMARHGGLLYLVLYVFCWLVVGIPTFYTNLCVAQMSRLPVTEIYRHIMPFAHGFGWALFVLRALTWYPSYVGEIMVICWYFWWLPTHAQPLGCSDKNDTNSSKCSGLTVWAESFRRTYEHEIFDVSTDSESLVSGELRVSLLVCLVVVCCLAGSAACCRIRVIGTLATFTATFPFLLLVLLLINTVSLTNAGAGMNAMFSKPSDTFWRESTHYSDSFFQRLFLAAYDAVDQVIYSLGLQDVAIYFIGANAKFYTNTYRVTWLVGALDLLVSLLGAVLIFSIIGYLDDQLGSITAARIVHDMINHPNMAMYEFVPLAFVHTTAPGFLLLVFYFLMLAITLDTLVLAMSGLAVCLRIQILQTAKIGRKLSRFSKVTIDRCAVVLLSVFFFLVNLLSATSHGYRWISFLSFCSMFSVSFLLLFEVCVPLIYGFQPWRQLFHRMLENSCTCRKCPDWLIQSFGATGRFLDVTRVASLPFLVLLNIYSVGLAATGKIGSSSSLFESIAGGILSAAPLCVFVTFFVYKVLRAVVNRPDCVTRRFELFKLFHPTLTWFTAIDRAEYQAISQEGGMSTSTTKTSKTTRMNRRMRTDRAVALSNTNKTNTTPVKKSTRKTSIRSDESDTASSHSMSGTQKDDASQIDSKQKKIL